MSDRLAVTDEAIRAAFSRRSTAGTSIGLASAITAQTAGMAQRTPWPSFLGRHLRSGDRMSRTVFAVVGIGTFVLLAAVGLALLAGREPTIVGPPVATESPEHPASPPRELPTAQQRSAIATLVDAVNNRDVDVFIDAFVADGAFDPRGDFQAEIFANRLSVARPALVQAWMVIPTAWDLKAEVVDCWLVPIPEFGGHSENPDAVVRCEVEARWQTLSLEVTEAWTFELKGALVAHWEYELLDLNPAQRTLPLGYDEIEAWEAWLGATRPNEVGLYLNPRSSPGPGEPETARLYLTPEHDLTLDGHRFAPDGFLPWDPANADEIKASIDEYLETRP